VLCWWCCPHRRQAVTFWAVIDLIVELVFPVVVIYVDCCSLLVLLLIMIGGVVTVNISLLILIDCWISWLR
jgi:hypothetical protein